MPESAFYNVPPEIWEKVIAQVGRRDLPALVLASRATCPVANRLLYSTLELSFCKCSESYYNALARTITNNADLAALVMYLLIDMKTPCKVRTTTSFDNSHSTRTWTPFRPSVILSAMADYRRYSSPKGQADWNFEAVQTLLNPQALDILSRLYNIEKVTMILGHYQQNSEIISTLLSRLPGSILPSLRSIKVYDASLVSTPSLTLATSLRVIDLGYVTADNSELCTVVSQNAVTLEKIRLHWIMEPGQKLLFQDYSGPAIKCLKEFSSQGPYAFSFAGLKRLLGHASSLEDLRLESQSVASTAVWTQIFSSVIEDDNWRVEQMRILKFGAPTGCTEFWDSVIKFLCRCGSGLTSLSINGTPRGSVGPFPSGFLTYFLDHPQPKLASLVLMWRDDRGLSPESAVTLASFAPSLEMFHTCLSCPSNLNDSLLGMLSPFTNLCRVHLTFLKYSRRGGEQGHPAFLHSTTYDELMGHISHKDPLFQDFVRRAAAQHSKLEELSWSVYDRIKYTGEGPKAYVKINRIDPNVQRSQVLEEAENVCNLSESIALENLGDECRKYESMESVRFRCTVGTKKVLLNQKPSWRVDMGNPFLKTHRVCQYAEFNDVVEEERPRRREL